MYTTELTLTRGGRFASWLAVAAPFVAALIGLFNVTAIVPADALWGTRLPLTITLAVATVAAAAIAGLMVWRGIYDGSLAPLRVACFAGIPWAVGLASTFMSARGIETRLHGATSAALPVLAAAQAEAETARLAGALASWSLAGGIAYALAIAAFLWRPAGRRLAGSMVALGALLPFAGYVAWMSPQLPGPPAFRTAFLGLAFVAGPFYLVLAGAALGDTPAAHPRPAWSIIVPALLCLACLAAASAMLSATRGHAAFAAALAPAGDQAAARAAAELDLATARRFRWLATLLSALPLAALTARASRHRAASTGVTRAAAGVLLLGGLLFVLDTSVSVVGSRGGEDPAQPVETAVDSPAEAGRRASDLPPPPPPPRRRGDDDSMLRNVDVQPADPETSAGDQTAWPEGTTDDPFTVSIRELVVTFRPQLRTPVDALAEGERVMAVVEVVIDVDGGVFATKILRSTDVTAVDEYILQTMPQWRFAPYVVDGVPVAAKTTLTMSFAGGRQTPTARQRRS